MASSTSFLEKSSSVAKAMGGGSVSKCKILLFEIYLIRSFDFFVIGTHLTTEQCRIQGEGNETMIAGEKDLGSEVG